MEAAALFPRVARPVLHNCQWLFLCCLAWFLSAISLAGLDFCVSGCPDDVYTASLLPRASRVSFLLPLSASDAPILAVTGSVL